MIRELFSECAENSGYTLLPEQKLLRNDGSETFFIGASIMAHMEIFEQKCFKKYYTIQRVFSGTRLEDVGKYPLATPLEVMMSIFHVNDCSVASSIDFTLEFLTDYVKIDKEDIFFLVPDKFEIKETLINKGISENNMVVWGENLPLYVGKDRPTGVYLKLFFRYKHGVIPCGTLGYLPSEKGINVDSAFFLERLDFVKKNQDNMYCGVYFEDIMSAIKSSKWLSKYPELDQYLWANNVRSIIMLLNDGATMGGKGGSHVLKKLIRSLVFSAIVQGEVGGLSEVISGGICSLKKLGYEIFDYKEIINTIEKHFTNTYNQTIGVMDKYTSWICAEDDYTESDFKKWHEEKGIPYSLLATIADEAGKTIDFPQQQKRFWFRNECYSFNSNNKIEDVKEFLINSELKRMVK